METSLLCRISSDDAAMSDLLDGIFLLADGYIP